MTDVTQILSQIDSGNPSAAEQLLPLVYDELRRLAAHRLAHEKPGQTLQSTALVHEAYLRLMDGVKVQSWNGRGHFFAAAAEAMRRIQGDADGDHDIHGGDFLIWQRHLGSGLPAVGPSAAVPEPATIVVLLVATAGYRRRGSRRAWEVPKLVEP